MHLRVKSDLNTERGNVIFVFIHVSALNVHINNFQSNHHLDTSRRAKYF